MEAYFNSLGRKFTMVAKITDLPHDAQMHMLHALMQSTGYAEALFKGANKAMQKHIDEAWRSAGRNATAEAAAASLQGDRAHRT